VFKHAINFPSKVVFHYCHNKSFLNHVFTFFRNHEFLYDSVIEVFKLKMFVPYHNEFIANFMIYLTSFVKKTNSFENVSIANLLKHFFCIIFILSVYLV